MTADDLKAELQNLAKRGLTLDANGDLVALDPPTPATKAGRALLGYDNNGRCWICYTIYPHHGHIERRPCPMPALILASEAVAAQDAEVQVLTTTVERLLEVNAAQDGTVTALREVVKAADWDHEPEPWRQMAREALADTAPAAQAERDFPPNPMGPPDAHWHFMGCACESNRERIEAQAVAAWLASPEAEQRLAAAVDGIADLEYIAGNPDRVARAILAALRGEG